MYWACFQRHCHLHSQQTSLSQNISFANDASILLGFRTTFLQPISVCSTGTEWIVQKWFISTIGTLPNSDGSNMSFRILFHYSCFNCRKVNIRFIYSGFNTFSLLLRKNIKCTYWNLFRRFALHKWWKKADIKLPKILSGFFKLLFYVVLKYELLNIELNSKGLPKMNLWLSSEEMHIP